MLYFYLSHMGGYYASEDEIEDLYCNICDDSDIFLGCFNSEETFLDAFPEYKEV